MRIERSARSAARMNASKYASASIASPTLRRARDGAAVLPGAEQRVGRNGSGHVNPASDGSAKRLAPAALLQERCRA